jgi:hypothetical protein
MVKVEKYKNEINKIKEKVKPKPQERGFNLNLLSEREINELDRLFKKRPEGWNKEDKAIYKEISDKIIVEDKYDKMTDNELLFEALETWDLNFNKERILKLSEIQGRKLFNYLKENVFDRDITDEERVVIERDIEKIMEGGK